MPITRDKQSGKPEAEWNTKRLQHEVEKPGVIYDFQKFKNNKTINFNDWKVLLFTNRNGEH